MKSKPDCIAQCPTCGNEVSVHDAPHTYKRIMTHKPSDADQLLDWLEDQYGLVRGWRIPDSCAIRGDIRAAIRDAMTREGK